MSTVIRLLAVFVVFLSSIAWAEVIPDYYAAPGLDSNRDYLNQHVTEHIDPFSGTLQMHHVDLALLGNGDFDLQFQRSYTNAESIETGPVFRKCGAIGKARFGDCGGECSRLLMGCECEKHSCLLS